MTLAIDSYFFFIAFILAHLEIQITARCRPGDTGILFQYENRLDPLISYMSGVRTVE
jgi:hypothetical protein